MTAGDSVGNDSFQHKSRPLCGHRRPSGQSASARVVLFRACTAQSLDRIQTGGPVHDTAILTTLSPACGSVTPAAAVHPSHLSRPASSSSHLKPCRSSLEALGLQCGHIHMAPPSDWPPFHRPTDRLDLQCCRRWLLKTEPPFDATRRLMILNPVATTTPHNVSGNADCCHTLSHIEEQFPFQFVFVDNIKTCYPLENPRNICSHTLIFAFRTVKRTKKNNTLAPSF